MTTCRIPLAALLLLLLLSLKGVAGEGFDHQHQAWSRLLEQHVVWTDNGTASEADYRALKQQQETLGHYLASLSAVERADYDHWSRPQQLAFLINAYNAFTIELILSRYPDLDSIKELGSLFSSPWKQRFFSLLGKERSLDEIEHRMVRQPGVFDEPRIHVALVCASIGCPALRPEAYTPEQLEQQLEDGLRRFLSDRSRNRYNPQHNRLEVSRLFDWYEEDFSRGHGGFTSLKSLFSRYAALLTDIPAAQQQIADGKIRITHLDYDWRLNDRRADR